MKYDIIYTKKIKNSFSNLGKTGEFKIVSIMNLLQDIAVEYAMMLKISSMDLGKKNMFWVISRYQIEINNSAKLNEDLLISVWRTTYNNLYDLRWFKIETEDKKELINAVGAWVIINKNTGSPARLNSFMTEPMLCKNRTDVKQFFYNLKMIENTDYKQNFKIRMHDLD